MYTLDWTHHTTSEDQWSNNHSNQDCQNAILYLLQKDSCDIATYNSIHTMFIAKYVYYVHAVNDETSLRLSQQRNLCVGIHLANFYNIDTLNSPNFSLIKLYYL